jgi:succinate dehydrogenase/fumarate reductase flavoprotein subunit
MASLDKLGEVISTDVLIVGGGISGLAASIKAKERPVDVLLLDKQTVGWAGKAPKGGGFLIAMAEKDNIDEFVEYHVRNLGYYLNDQELLHSYALRFNDTIEQFAAWGAKVARNADGKLDTIKCPLFNPFFKYIWSIAGVDLDMMLPFRARGRK